MTHLKSAFRMLGRLKYEIRQTTLLLFCRAIKTSLLD